MADISDILAAGTTKIVGSDNTGVEQTPVASTTLGDLEVVDGLKSGGVNGNLNLVTGNTAYEAKVGASRLSSRKSLMVTAFDNDMYWGYSNTVTTSSGHPLLKGQTIVFAVDPNASSFQVWLVCVPNNKNARITESP